MQCECECPYRRRRETTEAVGGDLLLPPATHPFWRSADCVAQALAAVAEVTAERNEARARLREALDAKRVAELQVRCCAVCCVAVLCFLLCCVFVVLWCGVVVWCGVDAGASFACVGVEGTGERACGQSQSRGAAELLPLTQ